jgi:hypothetical protein
VMMLMAGCAPDAAVRTAAQAEPCLPAESATVATRVRVLDAATGRGLPDVSVLTDSWRGTETDSLGWGCIAWADPGTEGLRAERAGYRTVRRMQRFVRGTVDSVEFRLSRADPPCCRLRGRWGVRFDLEEQGSHGPEPTARTVSGEIVFDPEIPDPMPEQSPVFDPFVEYEMGLHTVDFAPFFGGPVARDVSTTIVGGGSTLLREVVGMVTVRDSVQMTFFLAGQRVRSRRERAIHDVAPAR